MTVADINRLEQAARVSMGEFLDAEASVETPPEAGQGLMRGIIPAIAAIMFLAILWQLI
ncbi:hypothetical protein [Mesorhizobium sp. BH1-1-4]|uniref:hypothetical protein n=1 Tax=Mesorhizobium sp. BH1-1-4 TaxID=2876662 RepID=UPI001CD09AB5|nr:hypothetical protein [Mesorhizobium sp. BH1-1-4]MBZ9997288.1 hypothetical protein [Mesorhizobium sp. BH1-1-4]